jgi:hypothetical protein
MQTSFWHINKYLHHDIALSCAAGHVSSVPFDIPFFSSIGWQITMRCGVNSIKPSLSSCYLASNCCLPQAEIIWGDALLFCKFGLS